MYTFIHPSLFYISQQAFLDCHLMVSNPMDWVKPMAKAGANLFTFHIESNMPSESDGNGSASSGVQTLIDAIKSEGMQVGVSIKPGTSIETILPIINQLDLILIMTVEPGFSGQSFKPDMMPKVQALRKQFPDMNIQVDGGLSPKTVDVASEAGANVIVAASAIFGSEDRKGVIDALRASVDKQLEG